MVYLNDHYNIPLKKLRRTLVVGITYYGKSFTVKKILSEFKKLKIGGIIIDPHKEYMKLADHNIIYPQNYKFDEWYNVPLLGRQFKEKQIIAGNILYDFWSYNLVWGDRYHRPRVIIIEEAADFCGKKKSDSKDIISCIVKQGAKFGLYSIVVAQAPQDLDTVIRNQFDTWICHRLWDTAARMAINAVSKEYRKILPKLKIGECVINNKIIRVI